MMAHNERSKRNDVPTSQVNGMRAGLAAGLNGDPSGSSLRGQGANKTSRAVSSAVECCGRAVKDDLPNSEGIKRIQTGPFSPESMEFASALRLSKWLSVEENLVLGSSNNPLLVDGAENRPTAHDDVSSPNPYSVISEIEDDESCLWAAGLRGKAKTLVRTFRSMGLVQVRDLQFKVACGQLRKAVRACFGEIHPLAELSLKTVSKVEKGCCTVCEPQFDAMLDQWRSSRFEPVDVDQNHLAEFRAQLGRNVPRGWDEKRTAFVPNGHATSGATRREGGNWNLEPFSHECVPEVVFSSGKPRVVTKYSSWNTARLAPLHQSLYGALKRFGWLLVGPPTAERVSGLNGAEFLSFDYSAATDNIKTEYVRAAIDVLKDKATKLSGEEIASLDVLGDLRIDGKSATRGQPMGSVMSFPLLCLINKTVVDLALTQMMGRGELSFREWTAHRLLVNGDDLLLRNPRRGSRLPEYIRIQGAHVGLVVNMEKTMEDERLAEINSSLFDRGEPVKKFNASALWMDEGVDDVLKIALESCVDSRTFRRIVRANRHILAKQPDKKVVNLPFWAQRICRTDSAIRKAVVSLPEKTRPSPINVMPVVIKPDDYKLSTEDEVKVIEAEVQRVRPAALEAAGKRERFKTRSIPGSQSYTRALKRRDAVRQETTLKCLVKAFESRKWSAVREQEEVAPPPDEYVPSFQLSDKSRIDALVDFIRENKRKAVRHPEVGILPAVIGC